jgi:hypothetical protein
MTTSHRNLTAAFLRRTGLLVGLLAIIAGIFGMHVMTGAHSMHSPAAVTATTSGVHAADGHVVHQESGTSRARPAADIRDAAGTPAQMCSCSDCGTGMHAMTGSCIPSVKKGTLAAPSPATTVFGVIPKAGATGTFRGDWSYLAGTPSPGELSISRT